MSSGPHKVTMKPATTYSAIVGVILERLRSERGLDQKRMAELVGLGQSTWSRVENGASALTIEQLATTAAALGASPHEILALADRSVANLRQRGVVVQLKRQLGLTGTELLIGAAALALLLAVILGKSKK